MDVAKGGPVPMLFGSGGWCKEASGGIPGFLARLPPGGAFRSFPRFDQTSKS